MFLPHGIAVVRRVAETGVSPTQGAACGLAEVGMPVFDSVAATGREMLRNLIEARDDAAPRLVRGRQVPAQDRRRARDCHDPARGSGP